MLRWIRLVPITIMLVASCLFAASSGPVVTDFVVNGPVDAVWKAFTTKAAIETWMVAKTEFELKVGATWRTSYIKDSNLNDDQAIHMMILSYDPGRMLSYRTVKMPSNFPYPEVFRL